MRTRTSYQPAWPVTGSELETRLPRASTGSSSAIRWLQEALLRFVGVRREMPRAFRLADCIPRPYRAGLDGLGVAAHAAHSPVRRFNPDPAAVRNSRMAP